MNIDISVFASILHCQSELVTDTINTRFCFVHTYAEMFTCAQQRALGKDCSYFRYDQM